MVRAIKGIVGIVPDAVADRVVKADGFADGISAAAFHLFGGKSADRPVIAVDDRGGNKIRFK
jgi:hypothetical protein